MTGPISVVISRLEGGMTEVPTDPQNDGYIGTEDGALPGFK
jgi:hypothetical protein